MRPAPPSESPTSLVFGAVVFGFVGFFYGWLSSPAAQFAMWSLRGLAVAFALAFVVGLAAPRLGGKVSVLVMALAAALLCSAGVWGLIEMGMNNMTGWLLLIMGAFDAIEIVRYLAARHAMGG